MFEHETLLNEFYSTLARKFPEEGEFFLKLAYEEKGHANLVNKLRERVIEGAIGFDEGSLRTFTLVASNEHLKDVTGRAESGELSIQSALVHAQDLESALIEKIFFNSFISDDEEVVATFKKLKVQTNDHLARVRSKLGEYRAKN